MVWFWVLPWVVVMTRLVMLATRHSDSGRPGDTLGAGGDGRRAKATPVTEPPGEVTVAVVVSELVQPTESPVT